MNGREFFSINKMEELAVFPLLLSLLSGLHIRFTLITPERKVFNPIEKKKQTLLIIVGKNCCRIYWIVLLVYNIHCVSEGRKKKKILHLQKIWFDQREKKCDLNIQP